MAEVFNKRDIIAAIEAPPATTSWHPLRHIAVLDEVVATLAGHGFAVVYETHYLIRDRRRYLGVLYLDRSIYEAQLVLGVTNSVDKSLPMTLVAGWGTVDMLMFTSELLTYKHTKNGHTRFRAAVTAAIATLEEYSSTEMVCCANMAKRQLSDDEADAIMLRLYEHQIVSPRLLRRLIKLCRRTTDQTAWSLLHNVLRVTHGSLQTAPFRFMKQMLALRAL